MPKRAHSPPHEPLVLLTFFFFLLTLIYIGSFVLCFCCFLRLRYVMFSRYILVKIRRIAPFCSFRASLSNWLAQLGYHRDSHCKGFGYARFATLHALYNEPLPCDFLPVRQLLPQSMGNYKGRSCSKK
ncbi:hypothetical protein BG10_7114 [Bacillus thuringiensis serovar morrisoni]|nr:hypothetical protein BG10_7114 [Bacillus thuringiensis serovar morrisoni]